MIPTNTPTPPTEVWAVSKARLRRGHGPVRVETTEWVRNGDGSPLLLRGRANGRGKLALYCLGDVFLTVNEANDAARRIVRREEMDEQHRHTRQMNRFALARSNITNA